MNKVKDRPAAISEKVEEILIGLTQAFCRVLRTTTLITLRPIVMHRRNKALLRQRVVMPPLSFLIFSCFFLSIIINVYPQGWTILFSPIWLRGEIGQAALQQKESLISLEAIIMNGLPAFFGFWLAAECFSRMLHRSDRKSAANLACYAFGQLTFFFSAACFLPIIGSQTLGVYNESLMGGLWSLKAFIAFGDALIKAILLIGLISPLVLLTVVLTPVGAFWDWRLALRFASAFVFLMFGALMATELGSLPARYSESFDHNPQVIGEVIEDIQLIGTTDQGPIGAELTILVFNPTNKPVLVDATEPLSDVEFKNTLNGEIVTHARDIKTVAIDDLGRQLTLRVLAPGDSILVSLKSRWTLEDSDSLLTSKKVHTNFEGSELANIELEITYDLIDVDLQSDDFLSFSETDIVLENLASP